MAQARQTTAPAQYLGFSLQVNRLLWYLLHAEAEDTVSLEVLGDVAVTSRSGDVRVEEVKSRTARGSNPVADRSVELWKTLRNWADAVSAGVLDPKKTRFILYTSRKFEGGFLTRLTEASTDEQAIAAIDSICKELWGTAPYFTAKGRIARTLQPHLERIFSSSGREAMYAIVPRFSYEYGSAIPKEEMLARLSTKAVGAEVLNDVLLHLLGWVKDSVDGLIADGHPACIATPVFLLEFVAFIRKIDRHHILASFAPRPNPESMEEHLKTRLYISQLDLIEAMDEEKFGAIADYCRAETDRITWAARGLVHPSTFDEIEEELVQSWRNLQTRVNVGHKDREDSDRGKLLFAECSMHRVRVQGSEPPAHFTRGSFHALADVLTIGWHPKYRSLLRSQEEES